MGVLTGRVAIVTGAGLGIGREEALELARQEATVVVNDLDLDAARAVSHEITSAGGEAIPFAGDCADTGVAAALVEIAVTQFGRLDAVVNNAGMLRDRTLVNMTAEEWDSVIRVNLRSHYACTSAAMRHWRAADRPGRVVCTSSTSGILGGFGQSNYGAAKAGVAAFAVIAAQEGWRHGITVNAICPAARTRLSEGAFGRIEAGDGTLDFWDPANVAPLVTFLCSDASAHISGKVFGVQGDVVELYRPWEGAALVTNDGARWTFERICESVDELVAAAGLEPGAEDAMARLRYSMRRGA